MSEQAPVEETPEVVEEETTAVDEQPEVNWEKRYNDLRPEFDRTSQEAAQYRSLVEGLSSDDFDTRLQAAEALLGIEFVDTEDDYEEEPVYADPNDERLAAIEQFVADQKARDDQALVDRGMAQIASEMTGFGLGEKAQSLVLSTALQMFPLRPDGLPDIEAAHSFLAEYDNESKASWAGTKKGTHVSPVGTSGTQDPNLPLEAEHSERTEHMFQRYVALSDDT